MRSRPLVNNEEVLVVVLLAVLLLADVDATVVVDVV